jgi:hypothetical protein
MKVPNIIIAGLLHVGVVACYWVTTDEEVLEEVRDRIIFPLAGAIESCFLHWGGYELLLLVRKRESSGEKGEGATSVTAMMEANALRFLARASSLFCAKMAY